MGQGTGSNAGERRDSEPPAGWDAEQVAAYESFMRLGLKSGSRLREDTPGDRGHEPAYRVAWDDNNIVLPAAGQDEDDAVGFTTWKDSKDNLENFTRELLRSRTRRQGPITAPVALLHRADNTYNRRAISVATPPRPEAAPGAQGRRRAARWPTPGPATWATSPTDSLAERSASRLSRPCRRLASARGGEVLCTGIVFDIADLMLDLPVERVLWFRRRSNPF